MGLTGACSNQTTCQRLARANRLRRELMSVSGRSAPRPKIAPRPAPATAAIVAVLCESDEPLSIVDILMRVEQVLGRSVRRVSVKATLAQMAASDASPVWRVDRGRYAIAAASSLLDLCGPQHRDTRIPVGAGPSA